MEESSKTKYPSFCDCCEVPVCLQNKTVSYKHKKKIESIEMSKAESKALAELDAQMRILVPKIIKNNYDPRCIKESVSDFCDGADFDAYKNVIQAEVEQRLKKSEALIQEKTEAMEDVITHPSIHSKYSSELYALPGLLRTRKTAGNSGTEISSVDAPLQKYNFSEKDMDEDIAYHKAMIHVIEFEKFRRSQYAPLIACEGLKSKIDEMVSAKKSRLCLPSQEVNADF